MIQKIQKEIKKKQDNYKIKRLKEEKNKLNNSIEQASFEQEKLQEQEKEINQEREQLLQLDDKNLKVELILAMRGVYNQIVDISTAQKNLSDEIKKLQERIAVIEDDISSLEDHVSDLEDSVEFSKF
jgi:predicted  nucleic acid-binding Zn-ribbon protein